MARNMSPAGREALHCQMNECELKMERATRSHVRLGFLKHSQNKKAAEEASRIWKPFTQSSTPWAKLKDSFSCDVLPVLDITTL